MHNVIADKLTRRVEEVFLIAKETMYRLGVTVVRYH